MSTRERYGRDVWAGIQKHQAAHEAGECGIWASAAQVAERAGVSVVTSRKYLNMLVDMGDVLSLKAGSSTFYMIAWRGE